MDAYNRFLDEFIFKLPARFAGKLEHRPERDQGRHGASATSLIFTAIVASDVLENGSCNRANRRVMSVASEQNMTTLVPIENGCTRLPARAGF